MIEKHKMVSLIYDLREMNSEGKIIESLEEKSPLNFIFGTGKLLPLFETNLQSLNKGDNFSFTLTADQAYGELSEEMIINVPISVFENDGKVDENICRVGNTVPMMDSSGNPLSGIINEITDSYVKMDFNHPMAGVDLSFTGKILDVREASQEELNTTLNSCSGCGSTTQNDCSGSCSS